MGRRKDFSNVETARECNTKKNDGEKNMKMISIFLTFLMILAPTVNAVPIVEVFVDNEAIIKAL